MVAAGCAVDGEVEWLTHTIRNRRAEGEYESLTTLSALISAPMSDSKTNPPFIRRPSSSQHVAGGDRDGVFVGGGEGSTRGEMTNGLLCN